MKKNNAEDYYMKYLKESFINKPISDKKIEITGTKEKVQDALKKNFEKSTQKFYSMV